jgi:2-hydroxy-3-keto-5-methylthiopentenyl-1-phosphate phosphatase
VLTFPNVHESCVDCANCKKKIVDEFTADKFVIYIGNGLSDCCGSEGAQLIYAKDSLADHLLRAGIPFESYNSFSDIVADFDRKGFFSRFG